MILFRTRNALFEEEWSHGSFAGNAEEALMQIIGATLLRLDYDVEVSRDGDSYFRLGEEEDAE